MTKILAPKVRVSMADTGLEYDVQTDNRDMIRWERAAAKWGWPAMSDAPILWMTHLAYTALSRDGIAPAGQSFEAFADRVTAIELLDGKGDEPIDLDDPAAPEAMTAGGFPTRPDPAYDSVSS